MEPPRKKQRTSPSYSLQTCCRDVLRLIVNFIMDARTVCNLGLVCKALHYQNCHTMIEHYYFRFPAPLPFVVARQLPQLTHLQTLYMNCHENENLEKTLHRLTNLTKLQHLALIVTDLDLDSIGEFLTKLSNLQVCSLSYVIGTRYSKIYSSWTNLTRLSLVETGLKNLEGFTALQKLEKLQLYQSEFKRRYAWPDQLKYLNDLPKLTYFKFHSCPRLLESSFWHISSLTSLLQFKLINLGYLKTDSLVLKSICNSMPNLTNLKFHSNFNGPFPENFTNLQRLKKLEIVGELSKDSITNVHHKLASPELQNAIANRANEVVRELQSLTSLEEKRVFSDLNTTRVPYSLTLMNLIELDLNKYYD